MAILTWVKSTENKRDYPDIWRMPDMCEMWIMGAWCEGRRKRCLVGVTTSRSCSLHLGYEHTPFCYNSPQSQESMGMRWLSTISSSPILSSFCFKDSWEITHSKKRCELGSMTMQVVFVLAEACSSDEQYFLNSAISLMSFMNLSLSTIPQVSQMWRVSLIRKTCTKNTITSLNIWYTIYENSSYTSWKHVFVFLSFCLFFFMQFLWYSYTGDHPQEELAKFGYGSERKVEKCKESLYILETCCIIVKRDEGLSIS